MSVVQRSNDANKFSFISRNLASNPHKLPVNLVSKKPGEYYEHA
jgi:hypothetical protein